MHWDWMITPTFLEKAVEAGLYYAIHDTGEDAEAAHVVAMHYYAIEANL